MGPKKYRPRSIVGQGQLYQKSRILDLLGSHNIFFRTFTPNVRITVHLDIFCVFWGEKLKGGSDKVEILVACNLDNLQQKSPK